MAPFGYVKHPEIKNKLMIDEETVWIVHKIFDLAFHGMGAGKIAKTLIEEQVPSPGWFQYIRIGACSRFFVGQPEQKKFAWSPTVPSDSKVKQRPGIGFVYGELENADYAQSML